MNRYLKTSIYIMIFALLVQLFPAVTFAEDDLVDENTEVLLFASERDGQIALYEDELAEKVLAYIPDSTSVELLDSQAEYSQILYIPVTPEDEVDSSLVGFVQTVHIVNPEDEEEFLQKRDSEDTVLEDNEEVDIEDNIINEEPDDSPELMDNTDPEILNSEETVVVETDFENEIDKLTTVKTTAEDPPVEKLMASLAAVSATTLQGVALNSSTRVYSGMSTGSSILKSYKQGHILKFQSHTAEWYIARVYIGGKQVNGYIHVNDVDPLIKQQRLVGFATVQPVHVYQSPTRNAGVLKSYKHGAKLIYRTFSSQWNQATVIINGKSQIGYIHVNDVATNLPVSEAPIKGVAVSKIVSVYSSTSTSSAILKSYSQGHILLYRPFNSAWYEATVYVNGQARTGYINRSDVENVLTNPKTVRGVAVNSPTRIYSKASTSSKTLKSYSFGKGLIYRTFTDSWFEATVYVNGKPTTGYIHKNHVVNVTGKKIVLDPGHGGSDPGARASGIVEKELNLDIALRTKNLLESAGFSVVMTRTTDVFVALERRAEIANTSNADIFISIHGNSFNGATQGLETFWYGKYEKANSMRLAHALQNNLVSKMNMSYRRVAEGNFHVIRETKIPSALLEVGFIDNPSDAAKLKQSKYRQLAAEGIMLGALDYFR
jgi:N-acetylmuramoyl-L-alanine amidase